ncbi:MAG: hypothetical protein LBR28_04280 [Bacteroidales bacterium]|nr:hypothetical protein [Bacteroidales bacterium]
MVKGKKIIAIVFLIIPLWLVAQEDSIYTLKGEKTKITSPQKVSDGRLLISFSTINQDSIRLNYQAFTSQASSSRWIARLQYRTEKDGKWKDVPNRKKMAINFISTNRITEQNFAVNLPEDCNNQPFVQVSWRISKVKGNGVNPNIGIRDIELLYNNDPFSQEPQIFIEYKESGLAVEDEIVFNHIALPYTYPDVKRINIYGFYLRGDINLQIEGRDKEHFHIDVKTINTDSNTNKTINLYYLPKKEGKHVAQLVITTKKLSKPLKINIVASAENNKPFGKSQLETSVVSVYKTDSQRNNFSLTIPVFSNNRYVFEFNTLYETSSNLTLSYLWYRDNLLLSQTGDKLTNKEYHSELYSPPLANKLVIIFTADSGLTLYNVYFGSPKIKTMIKSGEWHDRMNWKDKEIPSENDFVMISKKVKAKVLNDVFCSTLILGDSCNVDIHTGKFFCVSDDIIYGKNSYFSVEQRLIPQKWNYISPAVNKTKAYVFSMKRNDNETWLMTYNTGIVSEHGDHWSQYITDPEFVLEAGHGYALYTQKPLKVQYDGILCNSNINFPLVSQNKDRWNLLGNPFTAPLDSRKLYADIDEKIQGNAIFPLDSSGFYNPVIIDSVQTIIPSLSAFFVEALKTDSEITFKRSHQVDATFSTVNNNASNHNKNSNDNHSLYERKNFLTLSVSNGINKNYIIFRKNPNAKNGFDYMDAHKLFGTSDNPEIYSIVSGEELSVNTFSTTPTTFGIGFYSERDVDVSVKMSNLSSIEDEGLNIFLEDKTKKSFQNICENAEFNIHLSKGTTDKRYKIHFVSPVSYDFNSVFLWADEDRILVCDKDNLLEELVIRKGDDIISVIHCPLNADVFEIKDNNITSACVIDLKIDGKTYKDLYIEI